MCAEYIIHVTPHDSQRIRTHDPPRSTYWSNNHEAKTYGFVLFCLPLLILLCPLFSVVAYFPHPTSPPPRTHPHSPHTHIFLSLSFFPFHPFLLPILVFFPLSSQLCFLCLLSFLFPVLQGIHFTRLLVLPNWSPSSPPPPPPNSPSPAHTLPPPSPSHPHRTPQLTSIFAARQR